MSKHVDLFGLLHGELTNAETIAAGRHLASCNTCQEELADAAVGHALLSRARTVLGPESEVAPPVPVLTSPVAAEQRSRRRRLVVLAAAAAVVVGVGGTAVWRLTRDDGSSPTTVAVSAPLAAVDATVNPPGSGTVSGVIEMVRSGATTHMTISIAQLAAAPPGDFYEAWLLDPSTNKMLPLGQLTDRGGAFDLDESLVASYSAVDVSLESDDGDPQHSQTSLLRGSYDPQAT